jgi:DNA polymerase III delta subunit
MAKSPTTPISRLHLVYGDDAYRVNAEAESVVAALVPPEDRTLGLDLLDGRVDTIPPAVEVLYRCREAILTQGFMGGRKTVWLREASFLGSNPIARSKDVGAAVEALAAAIRAGLPEGVSLVISAPAVESKSPLLAACREAGCKPSVHAAPKPWEQDRSARTFLEQALAERGLQAGRDAADAFVQIVGGDLRVYASEIEKLALAILPRTRVTEADVRAIVSPDRGSEGWDLQDAVGQRDLEAALAHYRRLTFQKVSAMPLLAGLYGRIQTLALLAELMRTGVLVVADRTVAWRDPDGRMARLLEEAFGGEGGGKSNPMKMNAYRVGVLAAQARQFTEREFGEAFRRITQAREMLVTSNRPETLVMELLLVRICRRPRR